MSEGEQEVLQQQKEKERLKNEEKQEVPPSNDEVEKNDAKESSENNTQDTQEKEEVQQKEETVQISKQRYEELVNAEAIALEEVKRARADSINFRRRVEKEKEEFQKFASAKVFKKLIPLLDDIRRLIDHGQKDIPETHLESIKALEQRLTSIFQQEGVKIIEISKKKTKFDPRYHEAVFAQPTDEVEPNVILEVVSNGFYKDDTVLRPAKVVISKTIEQPKKAGDAPSKTIQENKR